MKKGLLIVVSGPSGVGKGTVLKQVIDNKDNNLAFSISMTTRSKREGEQEGVNYYYVTKQRFEQAIANNELLEYAQFCENFYGTPYAEVERLRNEGKNVLLEIEVVGATKVIEKCKDALSIFIVPPSMEELESRIRGRHSETDEVIQMRLNKARIELSNIDKYQYVVCNQDIDECVNTINHIIQNKMKDEI